MTPADQALANVGSGAPSVTVRPSAPLVPSKDWMRSVTTRPVRAVTVAETCSRTVTVEVTSAATTWPDGTTRPS
jgi:hypothetical protein